MQDIRFVHGLLLIYLELYVSPSFFLDINFNICVQDSIVTCNIQGDNKSALLKLIVKPQYIIEMPIISRIGMLQN